MPFLELDASDPELRPLDPAEVTVVGSGSQAGWRISGRDLAARHFVVRTGQDGTFGVMPCSASNVVIVNGEQVPEGGRRLHGGDVLTAGSARFVFLQHGDDPRPRPPAEREPAFLLDGTEGVAYALNGRVVQIGREIGCHIVVRDPSVSRFHADIRLEGGEYVLYSAGATGTTINAEPVTAPRMLRPRDQIHVGSCTFNFIRGPLPVGVQQAGFEVHSDGPLHRRPTVTDGRAIGVPHSAGSALKLAAILGVSLLLGGAILAAIL